MEEAREVVGGRGPSIVLKELMLMRADSTRRGGTRSIYLGHYLDAPAVELTLENTSLLRVF